MIPAQPGTLAHYFKTTVVDGVELSEASVVPIVAWHDDGYPLTWNKRGRLDRFDRGDGYQGITVPGIEDPR
jgi:hypothetical protein